MYGKIMLEREEMMKDTQELIDWDKAPSLSIQGDWEQSLRERPKRPTSDLKTTAHTDIAPSAKQVAGDHYTRLKIQPMEYCLANSLNYAQSNAIKYITRYQHKNGIEDLKKAIHCIELLIEFEEKK